MAKIVWTRQARDDLRAIRSFIAKDAPRTAKEFVTRIRGTVESLRLLPESGSLVPELENPEVREIVKGRYRIIYRYARGTVRILTVFHGARHLGDFEISE